MQEAFTTYLLLHTEFFIFLLIISSGSDLLALNLFHILQCYHSIQTTNHSKSTVLLASIAVWLKTYILFSMLHSHSTIRKLHPLQTRLQINESHQFSLALAFQQTLKYITVFRYQICFHSQQCTFGASFSTGSIHNHKFFRVSYYCYFIQSRSEGRY